jgi:hypothetical protein
LVRRLLTNSILKGQKELPHQLQVRHGEASAKLGIQSFCETGQHEIAISRTLRAFLLVLDDAAADFEVGHHLEGVHDGGHAAPGALDDLADLGEQACEAVRSGLGRRE